MSFITEEMLDNYIKVDQKLWTALGRLDEYVNSFDEFPLYNTENSRIHSVTKLEGSNIQVYIASNDEDGSDMDIGLIMSCSDFYAAQTERAFEELLIEQYQVLKKIQAKTILKDLSEKEILEKRRLYLQLKDIFEE